MRFNPVALVPSLAALSLAFAPGLAAAQALTLTLQNDSDNSVTKGGDSCEDGLTMTWTVGNGTTALATCSDLEFWSTEADDCEDEPPDGVVFHKIDQAQWGTTLLTGPISFQMQDLAAFKSERVACPAEGETLEHRICARGTYTALGQCNESNETELVLSDEPEVIYDAEPPQIPTITEVIPKDSALTVQVEGLSDDSFIRLEYRETAAADAPEEEWKEGGESNLNDSDAEVGGLKNGTEYQVRAIAIDAAGNQSGASEVATGTPQPTAGFFEIYSDAGGQEMGGCAAMGGMALLPSVLAVVGLALSRRRRR